jgi:hypothetical protein
VVNKSHGAIAASIHRAVADLKARQAPGLDATKGIQTGELEVRSPFARLRARLETRPSARAKT